MNKTKWLTENLRLKKNLETEKKRDWPRWEFVLFEGEDTGDLWLDLGRWGKSVGRKPFICLQKHHVKARTLISILE